MSLAGLTPYDGRDYPGLYLDDPAQAGAFIDRRYLFVLRKPEVPSVIVETHHFLDLDELPGRLLGQQDILDHLFAGHIPRLHRVGNLVLDQGRPDVAG